jgi:starch synthase (maltosyl-transferring)
LAGTGDALALAAWWAPRLRGWHAEGVAGFRLLGLEAFDAPLLAAFMGALRSALPEAILLAWTHGLGTDALRGLQGCGLDGVFAPLSWDWQADGLWDEVAACLRVAPVIGVDGRLPDARHGRLAGGSRETALAAVIGQGWLHVAPSEGLSAEIGALNAALAHEPALATPQMPALPLGDAGRLIAVLRTDAADYRSASRAVLAVVNADPARGHTVPAAALLTATGGVFQSFRDVLDPDGGMLLPGTEIAVPPGGLRLFAAVAQKSVLVAPRADAKAAGEAARRSRLAIERPTPCVDDGEFPVKAVAGELVSVEADIVFDGHDKIAAGLRWHGPDGSWQEAPMRPLGNDRWQAVFPLSVLGRHAYVVTAWRDRFETFRDELAKKSAAGIRIALELIEGTRLVEAAAARSAGGLQTALLDILAILEKSDEAARVSVLLAPETARLMAEADDRPHLAQTRPIPVDAERIEARFASWYEVFPRSLSDDPQRHGTFADVERHLPRIAGMGFDVLYFPPISPIGRTNRKGRNNTLTPAPEDPGSPYAIGSADGGHDALHPQLGTLADFESLRRAAAAHGLELAIDFAIQCSPDHPWLKQHPGWFDWRPDGTIRYAENPPKKYEDIVNVDFYTKDAVPELWTALCDVVLFWAGLGVRLFRVDNPHTKPLPFWEWMIGEVRTQYPDSVFLAEAFTRPKVMYRLAKVGFSQSYTYFTWRNTKRELEEYLTELDTEAPRDFFRPHFFVNTPDINPPFLQTSGRPGFLIRAALAATLSGLWGVYNGFELCEAAAVPGKEEYLDSEKYQLRAWDWDRPGNIVGEITALNRIRRQNPALQTHRGVRFLPAANDAILFFEKATPDRSNVVFVAVSLDPRQAQEATIEVPLWRWKLPDDGSLPMQDLLGGGPFIWQGKTQQVRLTPERPYAIWRVRTF